MAKDENKSMFGILNGLDCTEHIEKKKNGQTELSYLSWAWAWAAVKKLYPDATYTIWKDENHRPYFEDPDFGLMCFTTVTIGGLTHEMWLPVMNGANKAMRRVPYTYDVYNKFTKANEQKTVEAATMFDINKTIMRCLVKNLAMFGLGLYIYAGEDLPEDVAIENQQKAEAAKTSALDEAIKKAEAVTSREELTKVWNAYKDLQANAKFLEAIKTAGAKFPAAQNQ